MAQSSGLNPPFLPWNTTKSLADDPAWMTPKHPSGDRNKTTEERNKLLVDRIKAGTATIDGLAEEYGLNPNYVQKLVKTGLGE